MKETKEKLGRISIRGWIAAAVALLSLLLFGTSSSAQAAFQGVGHFAGSTGLPSVPVEEEVQLGGLGGMAVNDTGNGGVPAGTVYAARWESVGGAVRIAMYTPKVNPTTSQLELEFALSWEVTVVEGPYGRCGPALVPATQCPPKAEAEPGKVDVDVDQATGNVYAYNATRTAGRNAIVEYTPTGSSVITRFGEIAPAGQTTAESPTLVHDPFIGSGLAVNGSGDVYIYDTSGSGSTEYNRLMKFRPKTPGVFTEYEYAGTAEDIGAGFKSEGRPPWLPVIDEAGDIFVGPNQSHVEKYDGSQPGQPPVCDFFFEKGGITALTVNQKSGTPFFFSYKTPKRVYQLGPCNESTGKFEGGIIGETVVAPERDDLYGLAFDPVAKFTPGRPSGVLYGGAPNPTPSNGVGAGEEGRTSLGYIFAPPEEIPPEVGTEAVTEVSESSARVHATINPNGSNTKFTFQYLTEAAYQEAGETFEGSAEPAEAPTGGGSLPNSTGVQGVAVTLTGLAPNTTYRYRAVATSNCSPGEPEKVCEDTGASESLHTYPAEAPGPHNGRAFELVSPAQKNGGQVLPAEPGISSCGSEGECKPGDTYDHFPMQSAPGGNAVVYEGTSFAPGTGVALGNEYIARRDPGLGWRTVNLTPTLMQKAGRGYKAFDETLSGGLLGQTGPALNPAAPPEFKNLYAQPAGNPLALAPLLTVAPPTRPASGSGSFEAKFAGASADLSRVFFEANDVLTAEVPGVAPEPVNGGPNKFNIYEWEGASETLRLVNVFPDESTEAGARIGVASTNAVSADGSRVFFSDEAGQVYVREGATTTEEIPDAGEFLSASNDGSRVLLTNGHLYDLETGTTSDLSAGTPGFQGIAGQSDDLSRVYFVDTEVLTEEVNSEDAKAVAGKPNLYAWSEEGPTTHFVGTLLASDNTGSNLAHSETWAALPSRRTAEVSPGGRYLAFLSQASLTGVDSTGPCESNHAGGFVEAPCPEVFLYDSEAGSGSQLYCASCNHSGATPLGLSSLRLIRFGDTLPQPRYLTNSGRLYFDSQDSLNQFDTNDGVEDVYEFEPEGGGGGVAPCTREGGCVTLISSGHDSFDANLLALDEGGANVFFTTRNRLNPADTDNWIDLYDAREGGGFGFETQIPQAPCQGEGCQLPAPTPAPLPPSSLNPGGEGDNVKPLKCKKGQVKKNGKCVAKHKPKKKGAKNKKRAARAGRGGAK